MGCKPILGGLSESQSHDVIVQFPVWRAWPVLSLRSGPGMATGREKTPQTLHAFPSRATGTASDPRRTHNGRSWRRREGTENLQCFFTRFLGSATAARHEPHALERRGLTATPPPARRSGARTLADCRPRRWPEKGAVASEPRQHSRCTPMSRSLLQYNDAIREGPVIK